MTERYATWYSTVWYSTGQYTIWHDAFTIFLSVKINQFYLPNNLAQRMHWSNAWHQSNSYELDQLLAITDPRYMKLLSWFVSSSCFILKFPCLVFLCFPSCDYLMRLTCAWLHHLCLVSPPCISPPCFPVALCLPVHLCSPVTSFVSFVISSSLLLCTRFLVSVCILGTLVNPQGDSFCVSAV